MTHPAPKSVTAVTKKNRSGAVLTVWTRNRQSIALLPVVLIVCVIGAATSPSFFTASNLINNVLALSAALGLVVIAESLILIGGYFDLSLQSTIAFSIVLMSILMSDGGSQTGFGLPTWVAVLIAVTAVVLIGLFNGLMASVLNLNAFIVTLAMLILLEGITLGISSGQTYATLPEFVYWLGITSYFGIPVQAYIFVISFALAALFMRYTPTGRGIYAMGGSSEAARAAGLRTRRIAIGLFIFGSLMAMAAGLLLAAQTATATPTLGSNMIFTVFAAAVLGGIDLNGGRGSLVGAALGVLLLSLIQNVLVLANVPSFWIDAAYGAIILGALLVNQASSAFARVRSRQA